MKRPLPLTVLKSLFLVIAIAFIPALVLAEDNSSTKSNNTEDKLVEAASVNAPDRLFMMTTQHCGVTQGDQTSFNGNSTTLNLPSINVPAGDDRLLVVSVHSEATISTVTFGGTAMTKQVTSSTTHNGGEVVITELWTLPLGDGAAQSGVVMINATDGSMTSSFKEVAGSVTCFSGIDQTMPVGATSQQGATGTTATLTLATTSGDLVVDAITADEIPSAFPNLTTTGGQTETHKFGTSGDLQVAGSFKAATSNSTTSSWSLANNPFSYVAMVLNQAADLSANDKTGPNGLGAFDPCNCKNPLNKVVNGEFLFHDIFTVNALSGRTVTITVNDGQFLDANGMPYPAGTTTVPEIGNTGVFQLEFFHRIGVTSNIMYSDGFTTLPFASSSCVLCPFDPIPTMSQWGLIIFGLLILNLGLIFVYKMRTQV